MNTTAEAEGGIAADAELRGATADIDEVPGSGFEEDVRCVGFDLAVRTAHDAVARLVSYAAKKGKSFNELSLNEYQHFSPLFGDDVYSITVESSLAARDNVGGTAPQRVAEALVRAKSMIKGNK